MSGVKISSFHKNKDDIVEYLTEKVSKFLNVGIAIMMERTSL